MISITRRDDIPDARPFGPHTPFVAELDGAEVATGVLMAGTYLGDETGRLIDVRWEPGHEEAARQVVAAMADAAGDGAELNASTNVERNPDFAARVALFESCGFELWQEKEGFWWADEGQDLPEPDRITARPLADIGLQASAALLADCTLDTLDRIDADTLISLGPVAYGTEFLKATEDSRWLLAEDLDGQAVGFVSVGEFEAGVGTIVYIGVLPQQRGRGYVDQLLRLANRTARELGFHGMLSDTDVLNIPMQAAFRRNGHSPEARAWHKWMQRMSV